MLSIEKVNHHLINNCEDTASEKDRFIKDMLIMIEFGQFESEDDGDIDVDLREHLIKNYEGSDYSEKDRFIMDMLTMINLGQLESEDDGDIDLDPYA